jgi:hypothetical protein
MDEKKLHYSNVIVEFRQSIILHLVLTQVTPNTKGSFGVKWAQESKQSDTYIKSFTLSYQPCSCSKGATLLFVLCFCPHYIFDCLLPLKLPTDPFGPFGGSVGIDMPHNGHSKLQNWWVENRPPHLTARTPMCVWWAFLSEALD